MAKEFEQALYGVKCTDLDPGKLIQPAYGVKCTDLDPRKLIQPAYGVKPTLPIGTIMQPEYGVSSPGLAIDAATYGRSATGAKRLKAAFDTDIENLVKVLNGDKYTAFKKTVNANWVGADADDFLADIEKTRASLEKSIRALKTKFNSAVDADIQQFAKFQSKNVK